MVLASCSVLSFFSHSAALFLKYSTKKKYSWREPDGFIIIDILGFKSIWETVCTFQKMKGCGTWQLWNAMLMAVCFLWNQKLFLLLQLRVTICTSEYNFKNIMQAPCTIGVRVSKLEGRVLYWCLTVFSFLLLNLLQRNKLFIQNKD